MLWAEAGLMFYYPATDQFRVGCPGQERAPLRIQPELAHKCNWKSDPYKQVSQFLVSLPAAFEKNN